jgi:hypothetical protein
MDIPKPKQRMDTGIPMQRIFQVTSKFKESRDLYYPIQPVDANATSDHAKVLVTFYAGPERSIPLLVLERLAIESQNRIDFIDAVIAYQPV